MEPKLKFLILFGVLLSLNCAFGFDSFDSDIDRSLKEAQEHFEKTVKDSLDLFKPIDTGYSGGNYNNFRNPGDFDRKFKETQEKANNFWIVVCIILVLVSVGFIFIFVYICMISFRCIDRPRYMNGKKLTLFEL